MAIDTVLLHETKHPDKSSQSRFDSLIGIDRQKTDLIDHLTLILDRQRIDDWVKRHHGKGLPLAERLKRGSPLVILAGEVGCGKTALATSIGTPLATALDAHVVAFETPSDIRGNGLVGDLSARVTSAFEQAHAGATGRERGILIIDEGDDLGAMRSQLNAHHEDRAGLNVLIKQIDRIGRDDAPLAVLLVTNRFEALDPALVRRAHVVRFVRPDQTTRRDFLSKLLEGTGASEGDLDKLVAATEHTLPFSYSDLVHRIAEPAVRLALGEDSAFSVEHMLRVAEHVEPTPLMTSVIPGRNS
jgi:SpoVK/Ycf46/Vps4 family AAA+-type ATPase